MRALALIDGEHYPDVVRVAFAGLGHDVAGAVLLGGTEKLRGGEDYGVPLFETLDEAFEAISPEIVVDLSDEPVADPPRRFRIASRVLARGVPYVGADFRFDPVRFEPFSRPALAVVGTGKRVGKTAVAIARIVDQDLKDSAADKALFFHARRVSPGWRLKRVASIGNHVFYR